MWEPRVDASEIGVNVREGVVTLTGTVKSWPEKSAAERTARRLSGVKSVADEIQVKLPPISERSDAEIARSAATALAWHIFVPHDRVNVRVEDGRVTLRGEVDGQFQKEAAEDAMDFVEGVKGVSNQITIKPRIKTEDIRGNIVASFKRNALLDAHSISVESTEGQVTLHGTVRTLAERAEAERIVWSAPGVTHVDNKIKIT